MVGKIYNRRSIGCGIIFNGEIVVVIPCVSHSYFKIAGITCVAIRAVQGEFNTIGFDYLGIPDAVVVTVSTGAAVKVVRTIVDGQLIFFAIEGETAVSDTVGAAAGGLACAWTVIHIIGRIFITDDNVGLLAVAVRNYDGIDASAE